MVELWIVNPNSWIGSSLAWQSTALCMYIEVDTAFSFQVPFTTGLINPGLYIDGVHMYVTLSVNIWTFVSVLRNFIHIDKTLNDDVFSDLNSPTIRMSSTVSGVSNLFQRVTEAILFSNHTLNCFWDKTELNQ